MKQTPSRYGSSIGKFIPISEKPFPVTLKGGGINTDTPPNELEEGEALDAIDVRFNKGGVATDYGISAFGTAYAGASLKDVLAIANYQIMSGSRFLMRMRPTEWDRWNGAGWLTLTGALTGSTGTKYSTAVAQDTFVAANLKDKLKKWDGNDATAVADLSADSPIAKFITKIGNRLFAAVIKSGVNINYLQTQWSADGNIFDWTNANAGAGSAIPSVEGADDTPGWITGLSTIERGVLIYRQRTLQLASLTGSGASPFRFTTLDFDHGTEAPYSVGRGGLKIGNYFLGYDYMPYHFDGQVCNPIGMPIHETIRDSVIDPAGVLGAVDRNEQEYYLAIPDANGITNSAWVFNIKEYTKTGRLSWRKKSLPNTTISLGYGFLVAAADPFIDSVSSFVDLTPGIVDSYAITTGPDRMAFGTNDGYVNTIDKSIFAQGTWTSKMYVFDPEEVYLDRVFLIYKAAAPAVVTVSVSCDSGITWQNPRVYNLIATGKGEGTISSDFGFTCRNLIFRIQFQSGFAIISRLDCTLQDRGRGNA